MRYLVESESSRQEVEWRLREVGGRVDRACLMETESVWEVGKVLEIDVGDGRTTT